MRSRFADQIIPRTIHHLPADDDERLVRNRRRHHRSRQAMTLRRRP